MGVSFIGDDRFVRRVRGMRKRGEDGIKKTVSVGVFSGTDLPVIAAANEFGAIAGNGAIIPARPFLRPAMQSSELRSFTRRAVAAYFRGETSRATMFSRIGAFAKALVQRNIGHNTPPPNAPSTVARKGFNRTLIDTGRLLRSIAWKVIDKLGIK